MEVNRRRLWADACDAARSRLMCVFLGPCRGDKLGIGVTAGSDSLSDWEMDMSQVQEQIAKLLKPARGHSVWMLVGVMVLWTGMAFAMLYPTVEGFDGWRRWLVLRIAALAGAGAMVTWMTSAWRIKRAGVRPAASAQ